MAFDTVLPLFVESTFEWDPTAAGLAFLFLFVPGLIAPAVGWLSDRYGPAWPSTAGFLLSVPALVCLRFVTDNSIEHKALLGVLLGILGVTLAFSNTPLMAEVSYLIEDAEAAQPGVFGERGVYGIAYGLLSTSFALGGTVGSLASGYLVDGPGWGTAMLVLGAWCASGGVAVGTWVGGGVWADGLNPLKRRTGPGKPTDFESSVASSPASA